MSALPMGNPGEDVPDWDERHDGYSHTEDRALRIYRGAVEVFTMKTTTSGMLLDAPEIQQIKLIHGQPDILPLLERMSDVINEALKRERALLVSRERRESGPPPD